MNLLLLTPPFTQLNTPYPATAYLKGFLNTKGVSAFQADLGIEVILELFSKRGLLSLFGTAKSRRITGISKNSARILALETDYCNTIDAVIQFLQGKNPTLALQICQRDFLPEASRFAQLDALEQSFGTMGTQDMAKHLATLYLEDLADFIIECIDPHFGFSRYAEKLGRSANSFDQLYEALQAPLSVIDEIHKRLLDEKIQRENPDLVLVSVPFPGNLFSAFRIGQWLKSEHPQIKIAMGGGFPNTELRSLTDERVFEFFDFITLDDGELPVEELISYLTIPEHKTLKRTFLLENGEVKYKNDSIKSDYKQSQVGTPDYSDLLLEKYISVIEVINPMHRLWSDGRWNKLTMAHGCYWGKCTFCDISLDYIKIYEPVAAALLCDRIEEMMAQTGESGFHFVDEAAPPALMRALALEILRRNLTVTWWTNIRFEKSFSEDLCQLLHASGCIAVSGGLEVASDRLLALIDKGVTVEQVARVTRNFTQNGIMVHAYLMYGYPTQTIQETVDSLEMVRQLFAAGVLQSGFWHQFALTAHSPIGLQPELFGITPTSQTGGFANNDIEFIDKTNIDHSLFSFGLKKSLFNFMHDIDLDWPLSQWFDFKIPKTSVPVNFIASALAETNSMVIKDSAKLVWLNGQPVASKQLKSKKGKSWEILQLDFELKSRTLSLQFPVEEGIWLLNCLEKISVQSERTHSWLEINKDFESAGLEHLELFWQSRPLQQLRKNGLLIF